MKKVFTFIFWLCQVILFVVFSAAGGHIVSRVIDGTYAPVKLGWAVIAYMFAYACYSPAFDSACAWFANRRKG